MEGINTRRMMRLDLELIDRMGGNTGISDYISDQKSLCLVADLAGWLVGYICCTSDACVYQIVDIFVTRELRRNGIGTDIIEAVKMRVWPDTSIEAIVDVGDSASIAFLRHNQFVAVDTPNKDSVLMRAGWRFRKAPPLTFRGMHVEGEAE